MGEADEGIPAVLVKGACYEKGEGSARELVMPSKRDLFG
jgi:F420-0:gamma-glutamyl ligase